MNPSYPLKIDAYSHIVPPNYKEVLRKVVPEEVNNKIDPHSTLYDLEDRFKIMDRYEPLRQVLTLGWPPVEAVAEPVKAAELARMANDEMAELVHKHPDRFMAAIGILPMNNMDAALQEADRVINELRFRGVYVHTPINDKPLDLPEFMPLYEKMSHYNLPIFIHPMTTYDYADYRTENRSRYKIFSTFGWPYQTTTAMARLVFSGTLEKYPGLKFVTHHCGGMVPYYAERLIEFAQLPELKGTKEDKVSLRRDVADYFKMFYADTAIHGNTPALMCAYAFFGADKLLFGADMPLGDTERGHRNYRQTINAIEAMDISDEDRKKIYVDNARSLMRLPI
jgi:predicted TIM-barrel fold metal-dependent hydrolase